MSRSYKKNAVCIAAKYKYGKFFANKRVRRIKPQLYISDYSYDITGYDIKNNQYISNGCLYKRYYNKWNIVEYKFRSSIEKVCKENLSYLKTINKNINVSVLFGFPAYKNIEYWKKCYLRK